MRKEYKVKGVCEIRKKQTLQRNKFIELKIRQDKVIKRVIWGKNTANDRRKHIQRNKEDRSTQTQKYLKINKRNKKNINKNAK